VTEEQKSPAATQAAGFGPWLIAGTPVDEPYPCRCLEPVVMSDGRTFKPKACNPAFCPCSGRLDPQGPECCAIHNTPARAAMASAAYALKRRKERGELMA